MLSLARSKKARVRRLHSHGLGFTRHELLDGKLELQTLLLAEHVQCRTYTVVGSVREKHIETYNNTY
jgi:hypothetical protein